MRPMRASGIACLTAVVVAMTACNGSTTSPPPQTSTPPQTSNPTHTSPPTQTSPTSTKTQPATFPLTFVRSGGVAGFRDVVLVAGDGAVTITRKGQAQRRCQLTPSATRLLTIAASSVLWSRLGTTSTHPPYPDELVTTVQSPKGGPVRLGDPQAGAAGMAFIPLLNDLYDGSAPAASRMCLPR